MLACELADDRGLPGIVPGQRKRTLRELLGVRNINGGRQCRQLADLIWPQGLRDFDILVSPLSRSAIAIALLLVPRSIARLKRALMRGGLSCLSSIRVNSRA